MRRWVVMDRAGRQIYLTAERWEHIIDRVWKVECVIMTVHIKPDWLVERELAFDDGSSLLWSYDTEGDLLEIVFAPGAANATVEIAQGVFFRIGFNPERALSLSFVSASPLLKPGEFGPNLLSLDGLDALDNRLRDTVIQLLVSPPVSHILSVFSYRPSPEANAPVPLAMLQNAA